MLHYIPFYVGLYFPSTHLIAGMFYLLKRNICKIERCGSVGVLHRGVFHVFHLLALLWIVLNMNFNAFLQTGKRRKDFRSAPLVNGAGQSLEVLSDPGEDALRLSGRAHG